MKKKNPGYGPGKWVWEEISNHVDMGIKGKNEGRLARIGGRPKGEEDLVGARNC